MIKLNNPFIEFAFKSVKNHNISNDEIYEHEMFQHNCNSGKWDPEILNKFKINLDNNLKNEGV
jgi:hypothetical protein